MDNPEQIPQWINSGALVVLVWYTVQQLHKIAAKLDSVADKLLALASARSPGTGK